MSMSQSTAEAPQGASGFPSVFRLLLRYGALLIVDAFALLLVYLLASDGILEFAVFIALVTLLVNYINLNPRLMPLQWISPGLALMLLMIVWPLIYTVYVAFTNFGDGNLLTKTQVIELFEGQRYVPADSPNQEATIYRNADGIYALWLVAPDGTATFAIPNQELQSVSGEPPAEFEGYTQLPRNERFTAIQAIDTAGIFFGPESTPIQLRSRGAAVSQVKYTYDADADTIKDNETGAIYTADNIIGQFVDRVGLQAAQSEASANGTTVDETKFYLLTGYRVVVGFDNFVRFLTSPVISGPLLQVFIWTVTFALLSVFTTFTAGLGIALLLNSEIPAKIVFRTLLIIPYAIPALISVSVWKGMLNQNLGVIPLTLNALFPTAADPFWMKFFTDAFWVKVGILLINLWLGYPYFMLVCSGALAAIPSDMYEAAKVDGANNLQQFWNLTLPMLLVAVGPLLIASFTFNFNNFVLIDVYAEGGPPIPGTLTPAGQSDILISYAFRLAFGSGRGADFGLASAITIIIFIMVATVTLFQFRFTRQWEETSKNV